MWYLIARARVLAFRLSVAPVVHSLVGGAPTLFCVLGSHQRGAQANAVFVTGLQVVQEREKTRSQLMMREVSEMWGGQAVVVV